MRYLKPSAFIIALILINACQTEKKQSEEIVDVEKKVFVPPFNADSAFSFVEKQVSFGPRVPNSQPHNVTGNYLVEKLSSMNWTVTEQNFEATTFDQQLLYLRNIIASYNSSASKRILLAAHWDTRPFADKDSERKNEPISGANDGASGVGVLLEIARTITIYDSLNIGIDIIFFDGEDWGERPGESSRPTNGLESWWCLGSQYWSKNKHKPNYSAYYGILLDMVGGKNAQFPIEGYSNELAPSIVEKVWSKAAGIGFGNYFVRSQGGAITDDHFFVNKYAKIPMIDIIPTDPSDGSFGSFHHTHEDDMDIISKETLNAVGSTVLHVIYNE